MGVEIVVSPTTLPHIEHVKRDHRFVMCLDEGQAVLTYRLREGHIMDIRTTYVPPSARGRGIAAALVSAALCYAKTQELLVIPTCSYLGKWLGAHSPPVKVIL